MSRPSTSSVKRSADWDAELPFGLPEDFSFSVVRSIGDVVKLFVALPNRDRGRAAKRIYEKRKVLGKEIAYSALMTAWEHDWKHVLRAFGGSSKFAQALRSVSPPSHRNEPVRVWRGVNRPQDAKGLSWTTDRDLACWFAMRYFERYQTAFLFTCLVAPDQIVTEHNGRSEHEVIPKLEALTGHVFLDEGNGRLKISFDNKLRSRDVSNDAIANWQEGYERVAALRKAEIQRMLLAARRRRQPTTVGINSRANST